MQNLSLYQKYLRNEVLELKGNIRVFWRIRPVIPKMDDPEDIVCKLGPEQVVRIRNFHKLEVNWGGIVAKEMGQKYSRNSIAKQKFEFDAIFGPQSTQEELFKEIHHLVISALDGYQVCIFAYGQTGSGKTFTMEGDIESEEEKGIIPRAIEAVFENIDIMKEQGWEFKIESSFQEIYMDKVRDLLSPKNFMKHINKALEYEPTVIEVNKADNVSFLLNEARKNRAVSDTSANERSSRSHSLFQLIIKSENNSLPGSGKREGSINLIDLAGSERIQKVVSAK